MIAGWSPDDSSIMPRKIALSPLQNRVLWVLEEAGEETVVTVKVTLGVEDEALEQAVAGLERLTFVQRSTCGGEPSFVLTPRGYDALTT